MSDACTVQERDEYWDEIRAIPLCTWTKNQSLLESKENFVLGNFTMVGSVNDHIYFNTVSYHFKLQTFHTAEEDKIM